MSEKKPTDIYAISFDTKEFPGKVRAVQVQLRHHFMGPKDSVRVDLCDHPLYQALFDYCVANPPSGFAIKRRPA